jgi:UPF0176 protein
VSDVLNISAYKFVALAEPAVVRDGVRARAHGLQLRGTVLVAAEGINLVLAGTPSAVGQFIAWLHSDARFADLELKESRSRQVPFRRLIVKLKREIIRMDCPSIQPQAGRAPAVDAATLARWLDRGHDEAGRPVVTLDARNAFEVEFGRFRDSIHLELSKFSDFPAAVSARRAELEGKTVVSYCTGGIRCEKATMLMRSIGLDHVYQLDGGVLKYFEHVGTSHWQGRCFVFDEREALGGDLRPAAVFDEL